MTKPLRLLIVEDSEDDAILLYRAMNTAGYTLTSQRVETLDDFRTALSQPWDVIVSDYNLVGFDATDALRVFHEADVDVPFIVVSGSIGEETAVATMRAGAHDYLLKGNLTRLAPAVEREVREAESRRARRRAEAKLSESEKQVRQFQKMEAIGGLAAGIAHDFNNLLSVILSYSELLADSLPQHDPMRADLEEIRGAGQRATDLTRQLLAFSRQQVLMPKHVNLNEVIRGMERMLRRLLGEDIQLLTLCEQKIGTILIDPVQIEQVVMNLAANARDAMPAGGKLTIETADTVFDDEYLVAHVGSQPGPHVMLAVTDNGLGMDRATRDRIFEPFFTTKGIGKGTGLGLATVFGIVQQSGGTIWVYSEPGAGTTFKIYFPRTKDPPHLQSAPSPPAVGVVRGTETILLVEDDPQVRTVATSILRRCGYHILEAENGGDALLICEQYTAEIHLLLTDVVMPRMNGRELAERLHKLRSSMRVIFMSGYTNNSVIHHGVLDAGIAFVPKPLTPIALMAKVRAVLDASDPPTHPS